MLLSELLAGLCDVEVVNFRDCPVTDVDENSKRISRGAVFVARRGVSYNGNDFIDEALLRGACAVVTEERNTKSMSATLIISKNATKTMAEIANALYGDVLADMTVIGITGTKGKTSTLKILAECIAAKEKYYVTVGTLGVEIHASSNETYPTENTTPNSPFVYRMLKRAYRLGARIALIEVSSQALSEYRVYGIPFTVCIFTNISRDHIGVNEHKSFEDYLSAKRSLFIDYRPKLAIVNADDKSWNLVADGCPRVIKVGSGCEFEYSLIRDTLLSTEFSLCGKRFTLSVGGEFNGINAALALVAASFILGADVGEFADCLENVSIPGRYEVYSLNGIKIIIDFAHNGQSVSSLLSSVRQNTDGRIILVFGSVGERCHSRRAELASAAEKLADVSVITSDNPGRESPEAIAGEIYAAFRDKAKAKIIVDREKAILYALSLAKAADSVLLVGKGQENYQLTEKGKVYFSERDIIEKLGASKQ